MSTRSLRRSAGILLHRGRGDELEVLLVHPGGPAWSKRDLGAWSIPKGEYADGEDPLAAARREFEEELGTPPPEPRPRISARSASAAASACAAGRSPAIWT